MKVAHFNTFPYGGAATAAKRLHEQLIRHDVASQFYYHRSEQTHPSDPTFHHLEFPLQPRTGLLRALGNRLDKKRQREVFRQFETHLRERDPSAEVFSMAELPQPTRLNWDEIGADVIHLHWMSFFADYPSFFGSIPNHIPIVWTLHDMNPFTGGCHYSGGCDRFREGCGACPQVINSSPDDVSKHTFIAKRKALLGKEVHVVTPSRWLNRLARQSQVWPHNATFHQIKLGFDLNKFSPVEKHLARKKLGLASDAILIGFGAEDIRNQRKGFHHLIKALPMVRSRKAFECLVFGSGEIPDNGELPPIHNLGYLDSIEQQRLVYSAADMVIVPSREDNQPQVGLEAMACGTPVIGFDTGGIAEYVREGVTGLLAKLGDERELARRISELVDHSDARNHMSRRARQMMISEFEIEKQSKKYVSLYRNLVQNRRRAA